MEEKENVRTGNSSPTQDAQAKRNHRRRPRHRPRHPQNGGGAPASSAQQAQPQQQEPQANTPRQDRQGQGGDRNRSRRRRNRASRGNQTGEQRQPRPQTQERTENGVSIRSFAQAFADTMPELSAPKEVVVQAVQDEPTVIEAPAPMPEEIPAPAEKEPIETTEVVGVHFRRSAKTYYFDPRGQRLKKGEAVIAQTANGMEYCEVSTPNRDVPTAEIVPPLRPIVRRATEDDHRRYAENRDKEIEAYNVCVRCIDEHRLDMKLIDTEYAFDNSKLLFYYISEERVDFRELVKELAGLFHVRIEMRQIGIRDEAKMLGGLGSCGRPFCCSTFLPDFAQVSIKMAKEQGLSLNSAKISGSCGRLMCCLRFEHETYEQELKVTPKVDSLVRTESGEEGIVTDSHPLTGLCKVRSCANPEDPVKVYARETLTVLGYQKGAGAKLLAKFTAERAQRQAKPSAKEAAKEAAKETKPQNG